MSKPRKMEVVDTSYLRLLVEFNLRTNPFLVLLSLSAGDDYKHCSCIRNIYRHFQSLISKYRAYVIVHRYYFLLTSIAPYLIYKTSSDGVRKPSRNPSKVLYNVHLSMSAVSKAIRTSTIIILLLSGFV